MRSNSQSIRASASYSEEKIAATNLSWRRSLTQRVLFFSKLHSIVGSGTKSPGIQHMPSAPTIGALLYFPIACSAAILSSMGGCVIISLCHHETWLPLKGLSIHMCAVESFAEAIGV